MIWVVLAVVVVIAVWFWRRRRTSDFNPVALVMLLEEPRVLSREHVQAALDKASLKAENLTEERTSYFRMNVEGYELTVASAPFPYHSADGHNLREQRLADAIERHKGCLLIDAWKAPAGKELTDSMPLIGRLMAEFVDESSLALYSTVSLRINMIDEGLLEMLREGNTDEAMGTVTFDAIMNVDGNDPRMVAAVAEARQRWPEFVNGWNSAPDRSMFLAKFPFGEGSRQEFMWITPTAIEGDEVTGILMNSPMRVPKIREGDSVKVSAADVNDWAYIENDEPVGLFTEKIVRGG